MGMYDIERGNGTMTMRIGMFTRPSSTFSPALRSPRFHIIATTNICSKVTLSPCIQSWYRAECLQKLIQEDFHLVWIAVAAWAPVLQIAFSEID